MDLRAAEVWRARLEGAGGVRDAQPHQLATGGPFRIVNGKITEYHTFGERVQALDWAGIEDPEPR